MRGAAGGDAGPTALAVSGNGQDFVDVPAGFAYEAAPVVHGVAPPLGFAGTLVTLTGAGLGGVSACLFGDASTPATVVSDTEVRCAAPAGAGSLAVGASVNGVDAYASAARFRWWRGPRCCRWSPSVRASRAAPPSWSGASGSPTRASWRAARRDDRGGALGERDGARVRGAARRRERARGRRGERERRRLHGRRRGVLVRGDGGGDGRGSAVGPGDGRHGGGRRGANLVFSPSLACRFAFFDVPASFVGPTELRCAAPAQSAGAAAFAVVDDRRVLYEATFEYTPLMAVRGASPPRGAAGTSVTVAGSGFAAYATAACASSAIVESRPSSRRTRRLFVTRRPARATSRCASSPARRPRRAKPFLPMRARRAYQTYGRARLAAGEPVTVYGADFVDASELACVFGDATTQARYVSSTELVCIAPVNEGVVDVAVTVNGVEFGASSSTFTYAATNATYELRPRRLSSRKAAPSFKCAGPTSSWRLH